jgi:hypothetical protein
MNINCEHVDVVLSAWFEGDLPDDERRAVDGHLRECLRCAALVRDLESIRREASRLPELVPSRDLWDGIAARIEAPVIDLQSRAPRAPVRRTWHLAAAAVVLMAVSSGVTYVVTREQGTGSGEQIVVTPDSVAVPLGVVPPPPRPSSGSGPVLVSAEQPPASSAPAILYVQEIARLRAILEQRRVDLDTATISAIEKSLKAIDAAILEARTALAADAASPFLLDQLNRALDKKLGVLRRVALMPVGAS